MYFDGLLAARLDDRDRFEASRAFLADRVTSADGRDIEFAFLRTLDGLDAYSRGDLELAEQAIADAQLNISTHFAMTPLTQPIRRFLQGEIMIERGEFQAALGLYENFGWLGNIDLAYLGLSYHRLAEIHERMGNTEKAIEYYSRLVRLWKNCDPELIPLREEARRKLDRVLVQSTREST
jgi:tetratricopeptide (TPR) repeat protein